MTQTIIRQFERDDLKSVVAINQSSLPENYPDQFFIGLHYHAPKAFLVAVEDGMVIGYIMCRIERGISSFGRKPVKKGHIVSVAVFTEHRRKGIGTELIQAAMDGMLEYGISEGTLSRLLEMGHPVSLTGGYGRAIFGRGQVILRDTDSGVLWGGSDPRADGCAMTL